MQSRHSFSSTVEESISAKCNLLGEKTRGHTHANRTCEALLTANTVSGIEGTISWDTLISVQLTFQIALKGEVAEKKQYLQSVPFRKMK